MSNHCIDRIRTLRMAKGWSQERLARELQLVGLDLSRASIAKLEGYERRLSPEELNYFAAALGVDPNNITEWDRFKQDRLLQE